MSTDAVQGSGSAPEQPALRSVVFRATVLDLVAVLPMGLVGALSVLIAPDVDASAALSGLLVGAYFIAGSLFGLAVGSVADRLEWHRAATIGVLAVVVSLTLSGSSSTAATLVLASMIAGAGAVLVQPATSAFLTNALPPVRRGLAMNIKVAAAPAAILLSGLSLPVLAQHIGWRGVFILAAAAACVSLLATRDFRGDRRSPVRSESSRQRAKGTFRRLRIVVLSAYLGAMVPTTAAAFMVPALVQSGFTEAAAGTLLALLGALVVLTRVLIGFGSNLPALGSFRTIAMMMLGASVGAGLMMWQQPLTLLVGGALAMVLGFAWMGPLFSLGISMFPGTPAAAASLIQAGSMAGAATGPLVGAVAVSTFGFPAVWALLAAASVAAGILLLFRAPVLGVP